MNAFDEIDIDQTSCAYRQLTGLDRFESFTVSASVTAVGTPTYVGRYRIDGALCHFAISAAPGTSIATTAGTSFFNLPVPAKGLGGIATMTNTSTNIAVGTCAINVSASRVYPPTQAATSSTLVVAGWYER